MAKAEKAAKSKDDQKSCFVVCPIGEDGSEIRARSDDIFLNLIKPVAAEFDYKAFRVIDDTRPGEITQQIVEAVMESDLVIADLSGRNPNVFYELALRHMIGQPFIHMVEITSEIPFDISALNAIKLRFGSVGGVQQTEKELREQIASVSEGKANFQNPVSRYQEKVQLLASGDTEQIAIADLMDQVSELRKRVNNVGKLTIGNADMIDALSGLAPRPTGTLSALAGISANPKGTLGTLAKPSNVRGLMPRGLLSGVADDTLDENDPDDE